jgi:hypothetical protein
MNLLINDNIKINKIVLVKIDLFGDIYSIEHKSSRWIKPIIDQIGHKI